MTIVSKRGQAKRIPSQPEEPVFESASEIYIYHASGTTHQLTDEESEHIRKVFDTIRKQLDGVGSFPDA